MSPVVNRPQTDFDAKAHAYTAAGKKLPGISTIAKVGGFEETWGIASAWGFRIGYEGVHDLLRVRGTKDELRARLQQRGLTPWSKRDKAAERGNWVHDVLEGLGQNGEIPDLSKFPAEVQGHAKGVLRWFLDYRPEFVSTEVQVSSLEHGFAGRYDIRCSIAYDKLDFSTFGAALSPDNTRALCLVDLKTSKGIYPTTHFPQLSGYELASVEMGFPATDAQFVLNTHPDGTYDFVRSWATPEDFLAYLGALNAVRRIEANDPEVKRTAEREQLILDQLAMDGPKRFADIGVDLEKGPKGGLLRSMSKRGLVSCDGGLWSNPRQRS